MRAKKILLTLLCCTFFFNQFNSVHAGIRPGVTQVTVDANYLKGKGPVEFAQKIWALQKRGFSIGYTDLKRGES